MTGKAAVSYDKCVYACNIIGNLSCKTVATNLNEQEILQEKKIKPKLLKWNKELRTWSNINQKY